MVEPKPVEENKQIEITLRFKGASGALATPTKFKYRLVDVATLEEIIPNTEITPVTVNPYVIYVTALQNVILNNNFSFETKMLSLEWFSGTTMLGSKQLFYRLKNNMQVPLSQYD